MFSDWQTIAVWLIIFGALAYVGRRGWGRVRSFGLSGKSKSTACASGCGGCGEERPTMMTATGAQPQNVLVQITSTGSASARQRKP